MIESEPLTFVYCDGPSQSERELLVCSDLLFFYFLLFLIERITYVSPYFALYFEVTPILGTYINAGALRLVTDTDDDPKSSVNPPFVFVIFDKENL